MKFLWIGLGILSLLLVISVAGLYCLDNTADQVAGLPETAWQQSLAGNLDQAVRQAGQAEALWQRRYGLVASMADHHDLEEISLGFSELGGWQALDSGENYAMVCLRLAGQIRELARGEKPAYYNFL